MKPKVAPDNREAGSVRVQFDVQFSRSPKGRQRLKERTSPRSFGSARQPPGAILAGDGAAPSHVAAATGPLPRVGLLLVLGHRIEAMIRAGELRDLADAARVVGVTRARITQITNLTLLAPPVQEGLLGLYQRDLSDSFSEREIRSLAGTPSWNEQQLVLAELRRLLH